MLNVKDLAEGKVCKEGVYVPKYSKVDGQDLRRESPVPGVTGYLMFYEKSFDLTVGKPTLVCAMSRIEQLYGVFCRILVLMRMNELTPEQFSSVPCPTCGVAIGERCVLHSGALRSEAHIDRKLSAAEAIETKKIPRSAR